MWIISIIKHIFVRFYRFMRTLRHKWLWSCDDEIINEPISYDCINVEEQPVSCINNKILQAAPLPGQGSSVDSRPERSRPETRNMASGQSGHGVPSRSDKSQFSQGRAEQGNHKSNQASNKRKFEDPLDMVKEIDNEAAKLELEVDKFTGDYQDKEYKFLDEMLTRCMLKLDNIDSNGREDVRNARRSTLNRVDRCINILESKGNSSESGENKNDSNSDANTDTTSEAQQNDSSSESNQSNESGGTEGDNKSVNCAAYGEIEKKDNNINQYQSATNMPEFFVKPVFSSSIVENLIAEILDQDEPSEEPSEIDIETDYDQKASTRLELDQFGLNICSAVSLPIKI
uniref:BAG domain-containing protein n=2 Tax=Tetranychus urticae TaxID=32264 RepID=T1K7D1_TETUR